MLPVLCSNCPASALCPLAFASGDVCVVSVGSVSAEQRQRLACLGLEPGAEVHVVRRNRKGPMVLRVDHCLFSICSELAHHIEVRSLPR